jgi:phosphoribosylamine--glycine ligase
VTGQGASNLGIPDRRAGAPSGMTGDGTGPPLAEPGSFVRPTEVQTTRDLAPFMKILLLGSGGREHALAWKIAASPLVTKLWCAPGNAGIAKDAECVPIDIADHPAVIDFCQRNAVDFVVVGPDAAVAAGVVDDLNAAGFKAFGPTKAAGRLESSKNFTKALCRANNIPTAAYEHFTDAERAKAYIRAQGAPIVVKADGLAAGKGVVVAMNEQEAFDAVDMMFGGGFGASGAEVVIEEFMEGEEASFFALCDGEHALPLATAQDHKRAFDGDEGPNTGGMGAYSPAPVMTEAMCARVMDEMIMPTLRALSAMGSPYKGVIFAGIMVTKDGPKLVEYNARFGDPECQVLMLRMMSDIVPALIACADGQLKNFNLRWFDDAALTVIMATKGYPGDYGKGSVIGGLDEAAKIEGVEIFHAGTASKDGRIVANGGRVLNVCALGRTVTEAQTRAYQAVDRIDWPEGFCRRDIGWLAVAREKGKS